MEELKAQGAKTAASANEAVPEADVVFNMLANPEAVEQVFLEDGAALSHMKSEAIWVDCSTVNPSFSLRAAQAAAKAGMRFMDAPVAGTNPQAANAELVFFAGAEKDLLETVEPFLNMMGNKVLPIGETGKGASFKMLVNIMLAQSMTIFSEAVLLGKTGRKR